MTGDLLSPFYGEASHADPKGDYSGERGDLAQLLGELATFIRRWVVLGDHELVALSLWIAHSHAFDAAEVTPYIAINSAAPGCGKTLLLEVLEPLVATPWKTGSATASVLMRKVHAVKPTLLLDESDQAFKRDKEYVAALQGLLNEGYRKRGIHSMSIPAGNGWQWADFSVFCAKAFAGIASLPATVESRSIRIRLKRKTVGEEVEVKYEADLWEAAAPFKEALAAWAEANVDALAAARPAVPPELQNRTAEVWRPLLAIADRAGGDWPERARRVAVALSTAEALEDEETQGIALLRDIRSVFDVSGADRFKTAELIAELASIEESPWGDYYGKSLTPQRLSALVRPFGVGRTRSIRVDGEKERGYLRAQFEEAWERYVPAVPGTGGTPSTARSASEAASTACTTCTAPYGGES